MRYLSILLLLVCGLRAAYVPGVGIPDPAQYWAGGLDPVDSVRPADPASWPSAETAGYYYVDNTHGSASDGNTYGCPNAPRMTWPTTLAAGSVVVVRGGPYTGGTQNMTLSGTSASPVWFIGDPTSRTTITRKWALVSGNYAFIENIKWGVLDEDHLKIAPTGAGVQISHIAVRNCEAVGDGLNSANGGGFSVVSGGYTAPTNVVFYACSVHDLGAWQDAAENDKHAYAVGTGTTWVWWITCEAYHNSGDGFGNGHDANHTSFSLFIDNCAAWENRENAVDLKEVHDVVISSSRFYSYTNYGSAEGAAIVIHYGPTDEEGTRNTWIINNIISNCVYGIVANENSTDSGTGTKDLRIIGNQFSDIHYGSSWSPTSLYSQGACVSMYRVLGNIALVGNTLYDYDKGFEFAIMPTNVVIRNNLFSNRAQSDGSEIHVVSEAMTDSDYNFFDSSLSGGVRINWNGTVRDLAATVSATGDEAHSLSGSPDFNGAPTDFTLASTSDAITKGEESAVYAEFEAMWGTSIETDRNGTSRPQGGTWDIGALEYDEGYEPGAGSCGTQLRVGTARVGTIRKP